MIYDWLTDWLIDLVYWVMCWLTEILYDWLCCLRAEKLTESCSTDLRADRAHFWQFGTRFSGRCGCREVKTRVNVCTVCWDKKSGLCREVAVSGVSTVYLYCCVKYWRTNYCLIGILSYWLNNWLAYWRRLGFTLLNEWLIVLTLQSG